jgi:hypothetical protein
VIRGAWLVVAGMASAAGCAWGPGGPFGEVATELDAAWQVAPGRDAGGGWQRLASDYQVRIDAAAWTTSKLVLVASADAAASFDPAAPPPGYSLCHNGHCHSADGRLVSYEEIAAELAGGKPPPPALELSTGALDLLAGQRLELGCAGAPCDLARGSIGRVELEVTALALAGTVRDGRTPPRRAEAAFNLAATLAEPVRPAGELELRVDRASAPRIRLAVGVHPGAEIFDAIDWAALGGGVIDLAATPEALTAITTAIGEVELALDVDRDD